jgi:pSer/pThr/pTyr-binding forkhead associated (FHA) protein
MSGPLVLALRVLLAASLYAFLGWALISLWRDINQQGNLLASRKVPPISLTVVFGDSAPQARHFIQPEVTIGRDPACECPVGDEAISARHARLRFHHNQWWLEDLESTNGTLLNQEKLIMPTVVISNDEIKCGETRFVISLADDVLMPITKRIDHA